MSAEKNVGESRHETMRNMVCGTAGWICLSWRMLEINYEAFVLYRRIGFDLRVIIGVFFAARIYTERERLPSVWSGGWCALCDHHRKIDSWRI